MLGMELGLCVHVCVCACVYVCAYVCVCARVRVHVPCLLVSLAGANVTFAWASNKVLSKHAKKVLHKGKRMQFSTTRKDNSKWKRCLHSFW
jgi:hypothetical protein